MKRDCEHCYHYIIQRGFAPTYKCLEEMPQDLQRANGKNCPSWHPKPKWMNTRGQEYKFQRY